MATAHPSTTPRTINVYRVVDNTGTEIFRNIKGRLHAEATAEDLDHDSATNRPHTIEQTGTVTL